MKSFKYLLKFSWRNLKRSPKRTMIMILGLAIGSGFTIWDLNFALSGSKEIMKTYLKQFSGFYHISHEKFYHEKNKKKFNIYKTISDQDLPADLETKHTTMRVNAPVFISGQKKTLGVLMTGIDVAKESLITGLPKVITEGTFLTTHNQKEIVIGKKLAQRIEAKIGDEVVVLGQAMDGSIANDLFRIVGLIDFGGGELEEALTFAPLATVQELMSMPSHKYHMRVSFDPQFENFPTYPNLAVTKWTELLPEIAVSIEFIDTFTWIITIILVLVISLGIANTLMISFLEREKEFQSLQIMGASGKWIIKSLCLEVFWVASLSVIGGLIVGHLATTYFSYRAINIEFFTGGQPIIMGGMTIEPLVKVFPVAKNYWQAPLMVYGILALVMIYPLWRVSSRSKNAI